MKSLRNNLLKLAGLLVLLTAGIAFAQDEAVTVNLSDGTTEHGQFLVDAEGKSLYMFTDDEPGSGMSACTGDCLTAWPPLTVASADAVPTAGEGLDASLFGTITRDDGTFQVTYNGLPLYYYAEDMAAGDVNGQGVGEKWYLVDATGAGIGAPTE